MPNIDWENSNGRSNKDTKFIDTLQDNFMYQHVDQPTRYRIGQTPTLDDLILSSTKDLIQDITYSDPLGKSDHICITFTIDVDPVMATTT